MMIPKVRDSIARFAGVELAPDAGTEREVKEGLGELLEFQFSYDNVVFEFTQISADTLTVNKFSAVFRFPTHKKQDRTKLLGVVNSFNKVRLSMKAVLGEVEKDFFQVSFSSEFICQDEDIVDGIIHPTIRILRSCGKLLVNMFGGHGITLKGARKDD